VRAPKETFRFVNVPEAPVPSLLRDFSAPVKLHMDWSDAQLEQLMAHDRDPFARWEAGQQLAVKLIMAMIADHRAGRPLGSAPGLIDAMARILDDRTLDAAFVAQALSLPSEAYIGELMAEIDPDAIHTVREHLKRGLGAALTERWRETYRASWDTGEYRVDAEAIGRRSLKNLCLGYLVATGERGAIAQCLDQIRARANMTDVLAGLALLVDTDSPERAPTLEAFYAQWRDDALVLDKWFSLQAMAAAPDTLERVHGLLGHPAFDIKNPNKVRALIGAFVANQVRFHAADGAGYRFLADQVLALEPINPKIGARLIGPLGRWRRYDARRQALMRAELERIVATQNLSRDVYEIASKSLA
jgi:aminopeptidase N